MAFARLDALERRFPRCGARQNEGHAGRNRDLDVRDRARPLRLPGPDTRQPLIPRSRPPAGARAGWGIAEHAGVVQVSPGAAAEAGNAQASNGKRQSSTRCAGASATERAGLHIAKMKLARREFHIHPAQRQDLVAPAAGEHQRPERGHRARTDLAFGFDLAQHTPETSERLVGEKALAAALLNPCEKNLQGLPSSGAITAAPKLSCMLRVGASIRYLRSKPAAAHSNLADDRPARDRPARR